MPEKNQTNITLQSPLFWGLAMGSVLLLAITVAAVLHWGKTSYVTLYSDLVPDDASKVVEALKESKTEYKLAKNGTEILVDQDLLNQVKVDLAGTEASLGGGVGLEVFSDADFGMTEFAQQVNYQRALQGELARTLASWVDIQRARVHLVLPEASVFSRNKKPAKAAVTLLPRDQRGDLSAATVRGVQRLVSSSVPGLSPKNVMVHDESGRLLSVSDDTGDINTLTGQLAQKRNYEQYMAGKVRNVIEQVFPASQVAVSVDALMNFNSQKTRTEKLIPGASGDGVIVKKREVRSHEPVTQNGKDKKNKKGQARSNTTTEYEYEFGRQVEDFTSTPGTLQRLNIAVVLPEKVSADVEARLLSLVSAATGFDDSRGDKIALYSGKIGAVPSLGVVAPPSRPGLTPVNASGLSSQPALSDENEPDTIRSVNAESFLILLLGALLGSLLGGLWLVFRKANKRRASNQQREALLTELRAWLEDKPQAEISR